MWETVSVLWRIRLKVGYTWNHPTSESQLTIAFDELSRFVDSNEFSASQWPVFARTHCRLCYNSIKMHRSPIHLDSLSLALAFSLPTVWCSIFHRTIQTMRDARMHVQNFTQRPWHTRCTVTRILINIYFTTFSFGFRLLRNVFSCSEFDDKWFGKRFLVGHNVCDVLGNSPLRCGIGGTRSSWGFF